MATAAALQPAQNPLTPSAPPMAAPPQQPQPDAGDDTMNLAKAFKKYDDTVSDADKKTKEISEGIGTPPPPPKLDPIPPSQNTSPVEQWGSAAMALATIGSALTRQPLTTALNSAAGVMKAFKQGDIDATNANFEHWKASTDYAVKLHGFQVDAYKAAVEKGGVDERAVQAHVSATAKALGDEITAWTATNRNMIDVQKLWDDRKKIADDMAKAAPEMDIKIAQLNVFHDLTTAQKAVADAKASGDPSKVKAAQNQLNSAHQQALNLNTSLGKGGSGAIDTTDPTNEPYIRAVANYQMAPPSSSRNPAARAAFMDAVLEVNPDYNETKYGAASKARRDFTTGKQGDLVRSLNVGITHLETLKGLASALKNGDIDTFNRIAQNYAQETGQPAPTNFDAAKVIVGDEIVKGIVGGQNAQSDREKSQEAFQNSRSPEQLLGAIETVVEPLMAGQLKGLRRQYEHGTGAKDFDEMLDPETQTVLEHGPQDKLDTVADDAAKGHKYGPDGSILPEQHAAPAAQIKKGTVEDGYEFIGGDPSQKSSWRKAQ